MLLESAFLHIRTSKMGSSPAIHIEFGLENKLLKTLLANCLDSNYIDVLATHSVMQVTKTQRRTPWWMEFTSRTKPIKKPNASWKKCSIKLLTKAPKKCSTADSNVVLVSEPVRL